MIITFLLVFLGGIITSGILAQYPDYDDYCWFSESYFSSAFPNYNSLYNNSFSSLGYSGLENYGNYLNTNLSYYDSFSPTSYFPESMYPFSGGLYAGLTNYNPFLPTYLPFFSDPFSQLLFPFPGLMMPIIPWIPLPTVYNPKGGIHLTPPLPRLSAWI